MSAAVPTNFMNESQCLPKERLPTATFQSRAVACTGEYLPWAGPPAASVRKVTKLIFEVLIGCNEVDKRGRRKTEWPSNSNTVDHLLAFIQSILQNSKDECSLFLQTYATLPD
jgi:hypothetical protein